MSEYFDITFIVDNKIKSSIIAKALLQEIGLDEEGTITEQSDYSLLAHKKMVSSKYTLLTNKDVIVSIVKDSEKNFDEIYIGISEKIFHKSELKKEIDQLTEFVSSGFHVSENIRFAVCGYELNIDMINQIKTLKDINESFLSTFPISYSRQTNGTPLIHINLAAQDIFTLFPCEAD